ncbi:alpha/beta-hydrolase, partial [Athelia psychrophila]
TLVYSKVDDLELKVDIYLPPSATGNMPVVVCYHGGGLVIGDRATKGTGNCTWMIELANAKGIIYISPDYRLLHPCTGIDELEDVLSLFRFLATDVNSHLPKGVKVDASRIAVSGTSSGGYLARQAAIHAEPRPVAFFSLYGMGGEWLSDDYLSVKSEPIPWLGSMLTQEAVAHLYDPAPDPIAGSALTQNLETGETTDALNRMVLFAWFLQTGKFVDHLSGIAGLSETLSVLPNTEREAAIPSIVAKLFPQLHITAQFPPSVFIHGDADVLVPVNESKYTHEQLKKVGVESELFIVSGGDHGLV